MRLVVTQKYSHCTTVRHLFKANKNSLKKYQKFNKPCTLNIDMLLPVVYSLLASSSLDNIENSKSQFSTVGSLKYFKLCSMPDGINVSSCGHFLTFNVSNRPKELPSLSISQISLTFSKSYISSTFKLGKSTCNIFIFKYLYMHIYVPLICFKCVITLKPRKYIISIMLAPEKYIHLSRFYCVKKHTFPSKTLCTPDIS